MLISSSALYAVVLLPTLSLCSPETKDSEKVPSRVSNTLPTLPWSHRNNKPSRLLKWTTDPQSAWWERALSSRDPKSSQQPLPATPTKCTYLPSETDPVCNHGCICSGSDSSCRSIYFTNLTRPSPRPHYRICTQWKLNHDSQLRYGLQQVGFNITSLPVKCGWQRLQSISELRVGRGKIDVNGTEQLSWGDPAEVLAIEGIMRREYPFVEILVIVATLVGPIFMCFGICSWYLVFDRKK